MSTSLLYHACGIRGDTLTKTEFNGGMVPFCGEPQPPLCGLRLAGPGTTTQRWSLPRVECRQGHVVRQIEIGFAEPRRGYTTALARYILDLTPHTHDHQGHRGPPHARLGHGEGDRQNRPR